MTNTMSKKDKMNIEFHEQLEQIRISLKEHDQEHKMLGQRLTQILLAGIAIAASYGIWVGTMQNRVTVIEKDLTTTATKVELTAAVANLETKIVNIENGVRRIEAGQEKIFDHINKN
jgi:hypothetical protein